MKDKSEKILDFTLKGLAKTDVKPYDRPSDEIANEKHTNMLKAIMPYAKKTDQKNLTPIYINYKTRKTKLMLITCPEWAASFVPFNIVRLSGVAKSAGFETQMLDLNVLCWNEYKNNWRPNNVFSFQLWDSVGFWRWLGATYYSEIHPKIEYFLQEYIEKILAYDPDVVGFSMYASSEEPTKWMCQELKKRNPKIKIIVGGSNVQKGWFNIFSYYDYVVSGEGEKILLDILEEIEQGVEHPTTQYRTQEEDERLDLNSLPMPDYESVDFSLYDIPNGITNEFSRGCTAKCTFCEETHFWKYRQKYAVDLLSEVEWLYYNKGVDVIWFIDSLVNGNLNELRAFAKGVKAKDLNIKWTGYARCDGRMDLEYYKDLADGGCIMLNYGIESGSQRVLDDMDKKVTVAEMEANLRDSKKVGILAATNWMVGFPTETLEDLYDNLSFLWRMRNMNFNNVGVGFGFGLGPETIIGQNFERYNLLPHYYQGHWITKDFTKGGTHVLHRVKLIYMFLDIVSQCVDGTFGYNKRHNLEKFHYKIKFHENLINEIDYESFDFNIITPNINPFADNLVNEIWPLLRLVWRTRGGFDLELKFNPEIDLNEFGHQYGPGMFDAVYKFSVTTDGYWNANFVYNFNQIKNPADNRERERQGPFYAQEFSRMTSNAAKRARRLARPAWGMNGRSDVDFQNLLEEEKHLNKVINFTFEHTFIQSGVWNKNEIIVKPVPGSIKKKIPILLNK